MPSRANRRAALGALLVLALLGVAGAGAARRSLSPTADEPDHVSQARFARFGGAAPPKLEQPGLLLLLAGGSLEAVAPERNAEEVRSARRAFPLLFGGLVLTAGLWAAARSGWAAGLGAAALVLVDPSLRGHGALVKTDVPAALFLLGAAALLDMGLSRRRRRRPLLLVGLSGAAYGLALATKASVLPFLPLFLLAALLRRRGKKPGGGPGPLALLALLAGTALAVLSAVQAAALREVPREALRASWDRMFRTMPEPAPARDAVLTRAPKGLASYAAGADYLRRRGRPGKWCNYLLGEVRGGGFPAYYAVAAAVKLPTATLLLLLGAPLLLAAVLLRTRPVRRRRLARLALARGALPGGLGLAYVAMLSLAPVDIGIRYAFPGLVLLLVAALGLSRTAFALRRRAGAIALGAIVLAAASEALAYRGREISFGNLLVGGPPGLRRVLTDSNVEWGQEQERMLARAAAGGLGRVGAVAVHLDGEEAKRAGVAWMSRPDEPDVDTVFVSTFSWDLAHALARHDEGMRYPWIAYVRSWLVPLVTGLEARAASVEPFGDGYLLLRLRPPPSPAAPPG